MEPEAFAATVRSLFFPMIGVALALGVVWRFVPRGPSRTALQVIASLLFFAPQAAVFWLWDDSILLVQHEEALAVLWLWLLAVVAGRRAIKLMRGEQPLSRQRIRSPLAMWVLCIAFIVFGGIIARMFVGDTFAPRREIAGVVQRLWVRKGSRSYTVHRYVLVNETTIQVTRDVFIQLHPGDEIRGEVGAGSGTLLTLER